MLDSHLHLWDLAVRDQAWIPAGSPIRRSFGVRDLRSALAGTPVDGVILVQVINDADETADFIDYARNVDIVRGVVGWADLTSPDFAATLSALTATGWLAGLRHRALAEAMTLWRHADTTTTGPAARRSSNFIAAVCPCGRSIRVAASTLAEAPITCQACDQDFQAKNARDA